MFFDISQKTFSLMVGDIYTLNFNVFLNQQIKLWSDCRCSSGAGYVSRWQSCCANLGLNSKNLRPWFSSCSVLMISSCFYWHVTVLALFQGLGSTPKTTCGSRLCTAPWRHGVRWAPRFFFPLQRQVQNQSSAESHHALLRATFKLHSRARRASLQQTSPF